MPGGPSGRGRAVILSDASIRQYMSDGVIGVDPAPEDRAYQPASVDLRLGDDFVIIGKRNNHRTRRVAEPFWLPRGACALACTAETIRVPDFLSARVEGKSTWGRRFLMVHCTAGFIDPGFCGPITLELKNLGPAALELWPGDFISQISFSLLDAPAVRPYGSAALGSHYQHQVGATPAVAQHRPDGLQSASAVVQLGSTGGS